MLKEYPSNGVDVSSITIKPTSRVRGEICVPGDKSISHRSIMLGAIANGVTTVQGFLRGEDNMATMKAFRAMGVTIDDDGQIITIHGKGLRGLSEPSDVIDCGNSGTTIRLITGLLAGQSFFSVVTGDQYLRKRPMKRVVEPLSLMGATISGRAKGSLAPLAISGGALKGIRYQSPVSSAQIKSALMLAGLYAEGETTVLEPSLSRDHSERMFRLFGASVDSFDGGVTVRGGSELQAREVVVPGDISSAAFFIVAALITPGAELLIRNVGVNPTRTGVIDILTAMGGSIELLDQREVSGEAVADLLVRSSHLKGIEIAGSVVPRAIDEFPAICVAAACAEGTTTLRDARELRVKETDRIAAMAVNLRRLGVQVEECEDGMDIEGVERLGGGMVESFGDHRIAMSFSIAALVSDGGITIDDIDCVATSFPTFYPLLETVAEAVR
ncbi:3-phosphoshikimate 1-carboxyvinyltransferase [Geobacter sp. SVR]|uniref:3-phosphoshikimate 1-carboxyvinyltransferase n=1 Tax=Geobacter sp. SVR TaxID=2495594 RepID=UPI00351C8163